MHLLYSNPLPGPEFVSLSLVLQPDAENPNGCGMGEPLLLASPLSTISYSHATASLKELHKYLSSLSTLQTNNDNNRASTDSIHYDQIVAELMQDDQKLLDKMQVFRPMTAHGIGLHYRLLRDETIQAEFASLVLASSRATGSATPIAASTEADNSNNNNNQHRTIEKPLIGVLICVGMSGLPYAHCSSSLQYSLSQRVNDCVGILSHTSSRSRNSSNNKGGSVDVGAAKTILSTLLATEDEVRKTNEVADAAHITAIPESGEDLNRHAPHKKGSAFAKSGKRLGVHVTPNFGKNFAGLLNRGVVEGEQTNLHVGESSTSNDLARALIERLNVLSVAEDDSFLRQYETSGQQRKANLDLTGNKSRFRKRKTDASTNADLDNFDYKGPTRAANNNNSNNRRPLRQMGNVFHSSAPGALQTPTAAAATAASLSSSQSAASSFTSSTKSALSSSASKSTIRQHKSDTHTTSRRNRAVPTLSAPRGDVSSSRRSSTATARLEDHSHADEDARSRRSTKSHSSSRRATTESAVSGIGDGSNSMEDTSENSRSSSSQQRLQVNIALNEDLTCSYKFSKMTTCSVEGVIQVQVKTNARSVVPFQIQVKDPSQHIQTLQENKKFAEDTTSSPDPTNRHFTISVPKADNYFPLIRYKCSSELRPVPIRVQTRVKVDNGFCRVALQISSNPHNEGSLTDLTIIMGVANDIKGESLVTQPAGGVWNASKRSVIWCVSELGDGEKFQLQARFELDPAKDEQDIPKFPVLVRCQCMYAQLSDVEVVVRELPEMNSAEVAMKVARRFRLSHQERS